MVSKDLIRTAKALTKPDEKTVAEYRGMKEALAAKVHLDLISRGDISDLYDSHDQESLLKAQTNHANFMSRILYSYTPRVLVETVFCLYQGYRRHGFPPGFWKIQLEQWKNTMKAELSEDAFGKIAPFYDWMLERQPEFNEKA